MKNIQKLLDKLSNRFNISFVYFPITSIYLFIITIYTCILVFNESIDSNQQFIIISLIIGMLCSIIVSLYTEKKLILNILISLFLTLITYFYLDFDIYHYLVSLAFTLIEITIIIYLLFKNNHKGKLFAYLIIEALYCFIICSILFAGISIVLAAIQYLIYEINNFYKLILYTFFIVFIFIGLSLFLSCFKHNDKNIIINKIYKTMFHKVTLILYFLLLFVLYIYLIKIIISFKMPVGQLNWFASFALLFNALFYISGQFDDDKLISFQRNYGGLLLIPIFIIQSIAIYIRIDAYGLTELRYLSICFNIIGLSFIISSLIKKYKFIYLVFVSLVLIAFISPINFVDLPLYNQEKILEKVLVKNNMLNNNTIIQKQDLSDIDKEIINSTYNYLINSESNKLKYEFKDNLKDTFGFDIFRNDTYCYYPQYEEFNFEIDEYKNIEVIEGFIEDNIIYGINISDKLLDLYKTYGNHATLVGPNQSVNCVDDEPFFFFYINIDEKTTLIFNYLSYSIIDDKIQFIDYHGFKLTK